MLKFAPTNKPLWQVALAQAIQHHGNSHNNWLTRHSAINFYMKYGGGFANPKPLPINTNKLDMINNLKSHGIPITASLMARSLDHRWLQYLGHETIALEAADQLSNLPLIIKPQGYFGIKASAFGYELMLPNARNTRIMISRDIGYTLMSLSRELSRRETKFTEQPVI